MEINVECVCLCVRGWWGKQSKGRPAIVLSLDIQAYSVKPSGRPISQDLTKDIKDQMVEYFQVKGEALNFAPPPKKKGKKRTQHIKIATY